MVNRYEGFNVQCKSCINYKPVIVNAALNYRRYKCKKDHNMLNQKECPDYEEAESNIEKVEKAINLVQEARRIIHSVMEGSLREYRLYNEYYSYGEFGLIEAVGIGNPNDSSLLTILEKLKEEGL